MSKEQIAFWGVSGLSARVSVLEGKTSAVENRTTLNEENILLLNARVLTLEDTVFPVIYGSFSSTITQEIGVDGIGVPINFDTTDTAQGCSLSGGNPTPKIQVSADGTYRVMFSIQADKLDSGGGGSTGDLIAYPMINSTALLNSATTFVITKTEEVVLSVEFIVPMTAGQTITIMCYSNTAGQRVLSVPATIHTPAIPSIILTLNRIA